MKNLKILFIIVCMFFLRQVEASSAPWPMSPTPGTINANPFYYYFENDTVRTALIKVAQSFDVKVHFSDDLTEDTLNQSLSGRFKVFSPIELYNKFSSNFAFTWFYYSGVLYIAPSNFITKNLRIAPEVISNFKKVLINDGILDNRFGWTEIPSEGMVVVSGPNDYVNLIIKKMKKLNISPVDQEFAIFHLKYASAADIIVEANNNQITIPGVATILKSLLQGNKNPSLGVDNKLLQQVIEPLKNNLKTLTPSNNTSNIATDTSSPEMSDTHQDVTSDALKSRSTITSPVIEADNRLNTIIIRDKSNNISVYKNLINLLDVPAPLIQVEVLILDVDQVKMNSAGISWWGNTGGGNPATSMSGGFNSGDLSKQGTGVGLSAAFGSVSPGNLVVSSMRSFLAGLKFMETNGYAKAESKSAVVTIDNIAAVVNLTESFYTVNNQNQQGTPVQTQMQMQITPHVIYDKNNNTRIKLIVALKDGSVEEKLINGLPSTLQGNLNSQAIIEEGNGLLLAGFSHKKTEQVESKVPLLGDIPIVGWLFKDKSTANRSLQRSYLVSPKIIWADRNEKIPNYSLIDQINSTPKK